MFQKYLASTLPMLLLFHPAVAAMETRSHLQGRLLLKLAQECAWIEIDLKKGSGDPRLDRMLTDAGVTECRRLFRHPPRGWSNPQAAASFGLDRWLELKIGDSRTDLRTLSLALRTQAGVDDCHVDLWGRAADTLPDDFHFSSQYALQNGLLNAPRAWDHGTDSNEVIAIIDSGADLDHPDLQGNIWHNPGEIPDNNIDDEGNGYIDDVVGWDFAYNDPWPHDLYGHGIHVSGIAGARSNNRIQIAGVCWSVPMMQVQVIYDQGGVSQSVAASAIVYAADNGATVLNNSYGFTFGYRVLADAVGYAAALDVVIVAAAHNQGSDMPIFPAAYDEVMGIIATDRDDQKPGWSNFGDWCDMAAPGRDVLSLWLNGARAYLSGTSMSSPHVAGAAALVRARNPSLDAVDTRWVLNYSAADLGDPGRDPTFGWGRLDLNDALLRAQSLRISSNLAAPGDSLRFDLWQPAEPEFLYVLLMTRKGRVPGTPLRFYDPTDTRWLPLNLDRGEMRLQTDLHEDSFSPLDVGHLDSSGKATITGWIPPELDRELDLDFAYLSFDPADRSRVSAVSTSTHLEIRLGNHVILPKQ